jgi:hypothetical protein
MAFVLQYDLMEIKNLCYVSLMFMKMLIVTWPREQKASKDDQVTKQAVWFCITAHLQHTSVRTQCVAVLPVSSYH